MTEAEFLFGDDENAIAAADVEYAGLDQQQAVSCPEDFSNYSVPGASRASLSPSEVSFSDRY